MSLICRQLTASYGPSQVLAGVGLEVREGEFVAVVGPNGSGKSTLLRRIAGLLPGGGAVSADGKDPSTVSRREAARLVALVPQNPAVPAGFSVLDYVLLGRTPHVGSLFFPGLSDSGAARRVLVELDLDALADRPLSSLSGGEFQRAVLGRALAQETTVLLLDEPTTALDLGHAQEVMELVDRRCRTGRQSVLAAMHDLTLAAQFCDRLVMLYEGRIVAEGAARDVVTEATLSRYYAASAEILEGPGGEPVVVPRGRYRSPPALRE